MMNANGFSRLGLAGAQTGNNSTRYAAT